MLSVRPQLRIMSAGFAFLHHVAAFTLVSAIAIEFVLIRSEITPKNARIILAADAVYGASAGAILIVGSLRVFFFEKGAAYYFHSVPFVAKGAAPAIEPATLRALRAIIHLELAGLVLLVLCAALMARGIGYVGA
jgi:putative membrane protein